MSVNTDEEENFRAEGLDAAAYDVSASAPGYVARPRIEAGAWQAGRDEFFACARLANDEDVQVEARGDLDILPDLPYRLGLADEFANHWRAVYISFFSVRYIAGRHMDSFLPQVSKPLV